MSIRTERRCHGSLSSGQGASVGNAAARWSKFPKLRFGPSSTAAPGQSASRTNAACSARMTPSVESGGRSVNHRSKPCCVEPTQTVRPVSAEMDALQGDLSKTISTTARVTRFVERQCRTKNVLSISSTSCSFGHPISSRSPLTSQRPTPVLDVRIWTCPLLVSSDMTRSAPAWVRLSAEAIAGSTATPSSRYRQSEVESSASDVRGSTPAARTNASIEAKTSLSSVVALPCLARRIALSTSGGGPLDLLLDLGSSGRIKLGYPTVDAGRCPNAIPTS